MSLRRDIATGGDPDGALNNAIQELVDSGIMAVDPGTYGDLAVAHDDGCPTSDLGWPVRYCTCEILELTYTTMRLPR